MTGSSNQLEVKLKTAQAGEKEAKRLHTTGERVLTRAREEKNKLQDLNTQLGKELKDVRAQLVDSVTENKRLQGGIFSMCSNLPPCNSKMKGTDRVVSVGMLTSRPEEEMSGSLGDQLQELSQMHEQAWQAMQSVAKALWPSASPPGRWRSV